MPHRAACLAVLLLSCAASSAVAQTQIERPFPQVTVVGEAEVSHTPDLAQVIAGVSTEGKTPTEATQANSRVMEAIFAALKQAGIAEADIRTARFGVQPIIAQPQPGRPGAPQITGFRTTNQVRVTLRNLDRVSEILDLVLQAGATDIGGVRFMLADPNKALDQVRAAAVVDARRRAALYAQAAGAQLGRVIVITEVSASGPQPVFRAAAAPAGPPPIAPGEETLKVSLTVSFELLR